MKNPRGTHVAVGRPDERNATTALASVFHLIGNFARFIRQSHAVAGVIEAELIGGDEHGCTIEARKRAFDPSSEYDDGFSRFDDGSWWESKSGHKRIGHPPACQIDCFVRYVDDLDEFIFHRMRDTVTVGISAIGLGSSANLVENGSRPRRLWGRCRASQVGRRAALRRGPRTR